MCKVCEAGGSGRLSTIDEPGAVPAPLHLHRTTVRPEWVDYNGHMSEWSYLLVMGDSSDALFRYVGIDEAYRAAGCSLFTVETHIRNLLEAAEGDELDSTLQLLGVDAKRVHLAHEIIGPHGRLIATGEQLLLHVDTATGRVRPLPPAVSVRFQQITDAHAALPRPGWVGQVMTLPAGTTARQAKGAVG